MEAVCLEQLLRMGRYVAKCQQGARTTPDLHA